MGTRIDSERMDGFDLTSNPPPSLQVTLSLPLFADRHRGYRGRDSIREIGVFFLSSWKAQVDAQSKCRERQAGGRYP